MLCRLHIEDFALIDSLDIEFGRGLNVLTGTTGAGKSVIVGALQLLLGSRGSDEMVRTGEKRAAIEGEFKISDAKTMDFLNQRLGIDLGSENFVVRREYRRKGSSRLLVGGKQVSLLSIRAVSDRLADTCGQHSHQSLLEPSSHRIHLDSYAGLEPSLSALRELYAEVAKLREKLSWAERKAGELTDRAELLHFQISEIERAKLTVGEEEKLREERRLLENYQAIREAIEMATAQLLEADGSAVEKIGVTEKSLRSIAGSNDTVKEALGSLGEAANLLKESVFGLNRLLDGIELDPVRLDQISERLDEMHRLKKKYGPTVEDVIEYAHKARRELAELESEKLNTASLRQRLGEALAKMSRMAMRVSAARKRAKPGLERQVEEKLSLMGMPQARFVVDLSLSESPEGPYAIDGRRLAGDESGFDRIQFLFCANPGEGLKPLAKVASGGEASRVMLALKNAFSQARSTDCEVFDEIDVGISGEVADKVASQLKALSASRQVICITHLHQIASLADHHFRVYKLTSGGRSVIRVKKLSSEERVKEIASLISGEKVSRHAIAGARELLDSSAS